MQRNTLQAAFILTLLVTIIFVPFFFSGYAEIKQAEEATTYPEKASHYLNAAKKLPWRADLYELAGTAYYHAKDYINAELWYQKAFQRGALSPEGWVAWGDVNYLSGNVEKAFEIWEDAAERKIPSALVYSRLANVYEKRREYSLSADAILLYLRYHPEDAAAHYQFGLLLTLSEPERALDELINATLLDPKFDPAVQTLRTALNLASINDSASERAVIIGRGLGLVGEWELALASFESAVEADANNAEAWAWQAEANQHTGGNEALSSLDRALALAPESSTVHSLRGLYFQRTGNHRTALTEFQAAARLEPENPALFVSLGDAYALTGDLILGMQAYQYATTLAPEDAHYWSLLATFCAQNNVHIADVAVPAAQKAVELSKNEPAAMDVLGWVLSLAARFDDAEKILLRALEAAPEDASVHFHLGVLYLQNGDRVLAYDHFIRARDLGSVEADVALKQYFP